MTRQRTTKLIEDESPYYTGTNQYYKHPFGLKYTDGAKDVADKGNAYWLLDLVASHAVEQHPKGNNFLVFKLKVKDDDTAKVVIEDGNDNQLGEQEIEFTDFPAYEETLWCIGGVILLPAEY